MKSHLHVIAAVLFAVCFLYDLVVWGGVNQLPEVGPGISDSAHREAPLAATYIVLGGMLDAALPSLGRFGADRLTDAFSQGFDRIRADPTVAMDLIFGTTWNGAHSWIKSMYWAAPILLVITAVLWIRRPKQVRALRR